MLPRKSFDDLPPVGRMTTATSNDMQDAALLRPRGIQYEPKGNRKPAALWRHRPQLPESYDGRRVTRVQSVLALKRPLRF